MRDFAADDRSQSETLGFTLLVGLTLIGVSAVVVLGGAALDDARHTTETQLAEQSLSQFDSEVSLVALGQSESRRVDLGRLDGGTTQVESDTGWLRIRHINYTEGNDTTLYNTSLGSLVYRNGETSVAYQGGGVWRSDGRGSVMISPPEIHYRGTTLVLPVIPVNGQGTASGNPSVLVRGNESVKKVYPSNSTYPNNRPYANPVQNGTIEISVHSEYHQAWADYFRTRTEGNVAVNSANETTTVTLVTPRVIGPFNLPADGNPIEVRGVSEGHPFQNFTTTLAPNDNRGPPRFTTMNWQLMADSANRRFEFNIQSPQGNPDLCGGNPKPLDVSLTYQEAGQTHTWTKNDAFKNNTGAFTYTCDGEPRLHINFTGETNLSYESGPEPLSFDEHPDADDERVFVHEENPDAGNFTQAETGYLVNHYLGSFGPTVDLEVNDATGNANKNAAGTVDEGESFGRLDYETGGRVITFLHVTETEVQVEFT